MRRHLASLQRLDHTLPRLAVADKWTLGRQALEVDSGSLTGRPVTLVAVLLNELQPGSIGGQCRGASDLRRQVVRGGRRDHGDTHGTL